MPLGLHVPPHCASQHSSGTAHLPPAIAPPCAHARPPRLRSAPAPDGSGADMALPGADLAGLIDDAYSLAEAGEGPISRFLDLLL